MAVFPAPGTVLPGTEWHLVNHRWGMDDLQSLEFPLGGNLYSFCSADGNHFLHPAGNHDPYGILCLQAHSAPMTAKQASSLLQVFGNRMSCAAHGSMEKLESELCCLSMLFGLDSLLII